MNRLAQATSPYLLQHADNPVDWWPWTEAAFAEARRRDVPVLLSVGYAACHWCHVMAHESFEDEATAALVNDHLVPIKVDREERPDVDAVYMTATQAMTGQGGWPMTVFLTPDQEPFYCGTYFPRQQFQRLVDAVARAWRDDRAQVISQASRIAAALAESAGPGRVLPGIDVPGAGDGPAAAGLLPDLAEPAVAALAERYDASRGGFGGAPKFPPSTVLEFLLRFSARPGAPAQAAARALAMASGTAEAMARGGMYDQLGGGFARYSVDPDWVVPHFEKMLYDNAQLARVYAHWWRRSGDGLARRVAGQTCEWMIRELATAEGGLASALDADSDGREGAFYVWTPAELAAALGPDDADFAAQVFSVTSAGTFEHGSSVLQLRQDPPDQERFERVRDRLISARAGRVRPARDDKVVAAWNGLAIAALAETGLLLDRPDFVAAAVAAAELLAAVHVSGNRIARTSRDGVAGPSAGVLEDYACVADGLLVLYGVTGQSRWFDLAGRLLETVLVQFAGPDGGFFDTAGDGERLIYRPADPADGPTPAGSAAAAAALLSYSALAGSARHRDAAIAALRTLPAIAGRFPQAAGYALAVAEAAVNGPAQIAVVGPAQEPATRELLVTAALAAPPGAVIALGDGTRTADAQLQPGSAPDGQVALLAGRGLIDGQPAAYVCRDFVCKLPVTTPEDLRSALRS